MADSCFAVSSEEVFQKEKASNYNKEAHVDLPGQQVLMVFWKLSKCTSDNFENFQSITRNY